MISADDAGQRIISSIAPMREDIARAKSGLVKIGGGKTSDLVNEWLKDQGFATRMNIDAASPECDQVMSEIAREFSVRLAFYQAAWELIASSEMISCTSNERWTPSVGYKAHGYEGGIPFGDYCCYFPQQIKCPPFASHDPNDTDIFVAGIDSKGIHAGIREALDQALACFRRGLYMPPTVMLAAAAEAAWTECGTAVAAKLSNAKLGALIGDQYASISKKVVEVRKALEQGAGKQLVVDAGQTVAKVCDAEVWTTVLRDRRNALHWGKARSFVADHADTANLLMAAQMHFDTLERIREAC